MLGGPTAERWAAALLRPPPSLADKLGVSSTARAFVSGPLDDDVLRGALAGCTIGLLDDAAVIVAVLEQQADLDAALALAGAAPRLALWCVYPKGRSSPVGGAVVRDHLRRHAYVDTKSSAVSDRLTATRYTRARRA